jgi:hypothetical protein
MPLNTGALPRELAELRDMAQQPSGVKHLVWHSGLSASSAQALGRVVNELPLHLHTDIAAGGIIDFAKISADYGHLAGWLMVAAAAEMVNYGPGSHWLLQADDKRAGAMVVGNNLPVICDEDVNILPLPYPAGSLCLAVLLNVAAFGGVARFFRTGCSPGPACSVCYCRWQSLYPVLFSCCAAPSLLCNAPTLFRLPDLPARNNPI